jgi:hypothetical protein
MFDVSSKTINNTLQNYALYRSDSLKSPHRKPHTVDENGIQKLTRSDSFRQKFPKIYKSLILNADYIMKHKIVIDHYRDQLENCLNTDI